MTVEGFFLIVAAVLVGNALCLAVVYMLKRAQNAERRGLPAHTLPFSVLLLGAVPFALVAWAAYSLN